jgi:hypothetical protein
MIFICREFKILGGIMSAEIHNILTCIAMCSIPETLITGTLTNHFQTVPLKIFNNILLLKYNGKTHINRSQNISNSFLEI